MWQFAYVFVLPLLSCGAKWVLPADRYVRPLNLRRGLRVAEQVELQRGLEQAQHSTQHLHNRQAAMLAERSRMPGLAQHAASWTAPVQSQSSPQHSPGEQRDSQDADVNGWRLSVETALQSALDLYEADHTVRLSSLCPCVALLCS